MGLSGDITPYSLDRRLTFYVSVDGLVQGCGNSSANTLELPQSCTKPSVAFIDGHA